MYEYRAFVTKVYDGDTITVDIDLGFGVQLKKQSIRLSGINAPEVRGPSRKRYPTVRAARTARRTGIARRGSAEKRLDQSAPSPVKTRIDARVTVSE